MKPNQKAKIDRPSNGHEELDPIELGPVELELVELGPMELGPIKLELAELDPIELGPIESLYCY